MDDIAGVFGSLGQVNTGAVLFDIILTTLASLALGVLITLFYAYMNRKKGFTLEFSVTIIAIRASGEIRILSSFITIFLQSGQNDFTRSVQTNFYISGRNVEKIGNLADLVALNF